MADAETRDRAPSARKLAREGERGELPVSAALLFVAAVLGAAIGVIATGQASVEHVRVLLRAGLLLAGGQTPLDATSSALVLGQAAHAAALGLAPVLGGAFAGALLAGVLQVGLRFRARAVAPDATRLLGSHQPALAERALDLGLAATHCGLLLVASAWLIAPSVRGLLALPSAEPVLAARSIKALGAELATGLLTALVMIAVADVVQRRIRYGLRMRMTRTEQADELRETEGDPRVRAARRDRMRAGVGTQP